MSEHSKAHEHAVEARKPRRLYCVSGPFDGKTVVIHNDVKTVRIPMMRPDGIGQVIYTVIGNLAVY